MSEPVYNGLTAGQIERFAYLMKECGEIYTACAQVLIAGFDAPYGLTGVRTNREQLEDSIARAKAANTIMMSHEDIDPVRIMRMAETELYDMRSKMRHQ